ncbi:TCB2 protein, partial [Amia calva]|nr:TCB2 protein [Amia calva]
MCSGFSALIFSGIKLIVLDPKYKVREPTTVQVLHPSIQEIKDKKRATLVCVASDFYPDHVSVSWKVNDRDEKRFKTDDAATKVTNGSYSISSRLRVPLKDWFQPKKKFTCIVNFYNGTHNLTSMASIKGNNDGLKNTTDCLSPVHL